MELGLCNGSVICTKKDKKIRLIKRKIVHNVEWNGLQYNSNFTVVWGHKIELY